MPCLHKFADDLYLERIDFHPETLIVGTFNPGWDNLGNTAGWFYGRIRNNYFWDVLPRLYGEKALRQATPAEWKAFCRKHRIALTDLIDSIDDADCVNPNHVSHLINYRDDLITKHFRQFTFVDITTLLAKHPSIKQAYLTRGINEPFWRKRWQPVQDYCENRAINSKTLLTPSAGARFQIPKGIKVPLGDYIFKEWQNSWHPL